MSKSKYNVYEQETEDFNSSTGEILYGHKTFIRRRNPDEDDEDYIRVYKYLNTVFAFKNIPLALVPVLIEISKYMTYADKGQMVCFYKAMREQICADLGIKINTLDKYIRQLRDADVLRPVQGRGVYAINPFCIGCGSTVKINELRVKFDFDADTMYTEVNRTNLITGKTIRQAIQEQKKKLPKPKVVPGQLAYDPQGNIYEEIPMNPDGEE